MTLPVPAYLPVSGTLTGPGAVRGTLTGSTAAAHTCRAGS